MGEYMELLLATEVEWSNNTCYNMNESWKTVWNKPVTKAVWIYLYEISRIDIFVYIGIILVAMVWMCIPKIHMVKPNRRCHP